MVYHVTLYVPEAAAGFGAALLAFLAIKTLLEIIPL